MSTIFSRTLAWVQRQMPTQAQLEQSRYIPKTVLRSELWRFNRRSVPRGVALGLFVGLIIPLAHFIVAAILAVFLRANVPVALLATFIGFPAFLPIIYGLAYKIGHWLMQIDAMTKIQPISQTMHSTEADHLLQLITGKALEAAVGLLLVATVLASLGYVITSFGWRWWIGRKRRIRQERGSLGPV